MDVRCMGRLVIRKSLSGRSGIRVTALRIATLPRERLPTHYLTCYTRELKDSQHSKASSMTIEFYGPSSV